MLENLNNTLFLLINATPASEGWQISLATFIARDLILIVPLLAAAMWLWGERKQVHALSLIHILTLPTICSV